MGRTASRHNPRDGLPTRAASIYAGCSVGFLERDRKKVLGGQAGGGPAFRKVGTEFRYDREAIDAWRARTTIDPSNPPRRKRTKHTA